MAKAKQDKVAMVVVKGHTGYSQRRFIDNIEEMEFYSSDGGGGGRVRFTMISTIGTAVNDGFLLTDDWSDSISRGEIIYGDTKKAPSWLIQGVCVELKHNKAQAVIKEVHRGSCAVVEEEVECGKSTLTVHSGDISLVKPREHDAVISIATKGYQEGVEGWLVAIDREDAIVKEADGNFKIVDYEYLAKTSPSSTFKGLD